MKLLMVESQIIVQAYQNNDNEGCAGVSKRMSKGSMKVDCAEFKNSVPVHLRNVSDKLQINTWKEIERIQDEYPQSEDLEVLDTVLVTTIKSEWKLINCPVF